jgi:hypothetical protein
MSEPACYFTADGRFTAAGHWSTDDAAYSTFKLFLCHISSVFEGVRMPWNTAYDNVRVVQYNAAWTGFTGEQCV